MTTPEILFYDGHCGLCHGAVRFALARDRQGSLRFAPLQGETLRERLSEEARENLPDSLVMLTADGAVHTRSTGLILLLRYLGGPWAAMGWALSVIPRPLRDLGYRWVAAVRHRLFKKPEELCPMMPPEQRSRFLP